MSLVQIIDQLNEEATEHKQKKLTHIQKSNLSLSLSLSWNRGLNSIKFTIFLNICRIKPSTIDTEIRMEMDKEPPRMRLMCVV